MNLAMLVVGIGCTLAGVYSVVRREAIVVRLRARAGAGYVQPPIAYAVVGVILGLAGIARIVAAVR